MSVVGAPSARSWVASAWSGSELIVWGGGTTSGVLLGDGARYSPSSNSWVGITAIGAPIPRVFPLAVWTGTEMILWGGNTGGTYTPTGARYNPASNSWIALPTTGTPTARTYGTAVWTGREMIIWGGHGPSDAGADLNDGARVNPTFGSWAALAAVAPPAPRTAAASVWTGSEMLIFGGATWGGITLFNDDYSYVPGRLLYLYLRQ